MPGGRPTDYRPEFCDLVVEICAQGYSLTGFAGKIGQARSTLNVWMDAHPEFMEAVNRAKTARAVWWEDRSRQVAQEGGPGGQATMVIFGLKNHAPEDYAERHEITGKDGAPLLPEPDTGKIAQALLAVLQKAKEG